MIAPAMTMVATRLNQYLCQQVELPSPLAGELVEAGPPTLKEGVRLTLIQAHADTALSSMPTPLHAVDAAHQAPPLPDLLILLSVHSQRYQTALEWLDHCMRFFHTSPVLALAQTARSQVQDALAGAQTCCNPVEITSVLHPLSLEETHQLWQLFNMPLQPHVCYGWRCRPLPGTEPL